MRIPHVIARHLVSALTERTLYSAYEVQTLENKPDGIGHISSHKLIPTRQRVQSAHSML